MWKQWIKDRGISKTARQMGVTRQTVHNWLKTGRIREDHKIKFIQFSGYRFTMSDFVSCFDEQEAGK